MSRVDLERGGPAVPLTDTQLDRARGAVLGSACGDALGAGYEFGSARLGPEGAAMIGGGLGGFAPGEWTDDTSMAWGILAVAAEGLDLRTPEGLTAVAQRFAAWALGGPADIGIQTSALLRGVDRHVTGAELTALAAQAHARTGRTAGNGALMRTGAVPLPYLAEGAEDALVEAAAAVSDLTHGDPLNAQACILWCLAIRRAVRDGVLDLRAGLARLDPQDAARWSAWIDEAERAAPSSFVPNGYVVTALQAAWAAITQTPVPAQDPPRHLVDALQAAIAIGDDTDTVAAIAGALLGARWGASAVPPEWVAILHGYPGITGAELVALADRAVAQGI